LSKIKPLYPNVNYAFLDSIEHGVFGLDEGAEVFVVKVGDFEINELNRVTLIFNEFFIEH
jgi:hypothetical protein